ncbi:MAG: hypothetical protein K2N15_02100 [Lachnospiraceae bacterium]|nr:hypothetical protein [Lachnospiraceae bacterium]
MREIIVKIMEVIDDVLDNHPMLSFVILAAVIATIIWIKSRIDEKKGINSPEKQRVKEILQKIMQEQENYDEYIPVYAYRRQNYGKSVESWHYAIALTESRMYVVPLIFGNKEIGYSKVSVISKEYLSKIESSKPSDTWLHLEFYDKNQDTVLEITVEAKNTKFDKTYPVNIMQVEEVRAFAERIRQWQTQVC